MTGIVDMSDIGGGKIDCFVQNCSSVGDEIFLDCYDFETGKCSCAIMDPEHARKLSVLLNELADKCEEQRKPETLSLLSQYLINSDPFKE